MWPWGFSTRTAATPVLKQKADAFNLPSSHSGFSFSPKRHLSRWIRPVTAPSFVDIFQAI